MGDGSSIEWTNATWNWIVGCSVVSPGCTNCYAMKEAYRFGFNPAVPHYAGLTKWVNGKPVWTGDVATASRRMLLAPIRWQRPRRIFVNSMGDLFHDDVPVEWIDDTFAVMAIAKQHIFQVLTKRSKRARLYMNDPDTPGRIAQRAYEMLVTEVKARAEGWSWPLPNVWMGVSAEDQKRADERIPDLLETLAAVRWVSEEPLLGPIVHPGSWFGLGSNGSYGSGSGIDWIVVGGESGNDARPMHPDWVRSIRDQCAAAEVPFFFKQWGAWVPGTVSAIGDSLGHAIHQDGQEHRGRISHWWSGDAAGGVISTMVGKARSGRLLDGREWSQYPPARAA